MTTDRQPYRPPFDCPVVNHSVTIIGEVVSLYDKGLVIDESRSFRCTGMGECKIFDKAAITKPTGCPYYDANCSSIT